MGGKGQSLPCGGGKGQSITFGEGKGLCALWEGRGQSVPYGKEKRLCALKENDSLCLIGEEKDYVPYRKALWWRTWVVYGL